MDKRECKILITFFFVVMVLFYLKIPIPCIFHKITNLYCPGCGITRMINAIFHFKLEEAFSYNAYVFILILISILYLIIKYFVYIILKKEIKIPNIIIYILIIIAIIFAILRNIPSFSYLAP